jgi:ribonuclease R
MKESKDKNYEKIRKDKLTSFFLDRTYVPMNKKQIKNLLISNYKDNEILDRLLFELINENVIYVNKNNKYVVYSDDKLIKCKYQSKTSNFGFGIPIDPKVEDIFIPSEYINNAMNNDEILVQLVTGRGYNKNKVGKIVKITKRSVTNVIGQFYKLKDSNYVDCIDTKLPSILINNIMVEDLNEKDMVEVLITSYPSKESKFEGDIIRKIASSNEIDIYVKGLYASFGLDKKEIFDDKILKEIEFLSTEVKKDDLVNRIDKTNDNVYTIDGDDAKDLDDAICVKKVGNNYLLSVHIADVSHYVIDGTFLDKEAVSRATSIYVPGSVIPMLPKKLSNGICSLNENVIRLTLSVDMLIDSLGNVLESKIYKAFIKSKKRMTYNKVFKCIEKSDNEVLEEYKEYLSDIYLMKELAAILNKKRLELGSINFDIPETKVVFDDDNNIADIKPYEINIANNIIEEFMLITNETVAEKFNKLNFPFIYRIHELPDSDKINDLNVILYGYGKRINNTKNVTPKMLSEILSNFKTEEEKQVISTVALRTLKLAKYHHECLGHFGLAFKYYCHFTSPIRRYPDLFIHRVISDYLVGNDVKKYTKQAINYSIISTEMEKNATKIERDFDDLYKAMFMKDKIGQEFEGVVSSVTSFGLFIKLDSTVEGLVHISNMDDYYFFDEKRYTLIGERSKNVYKIGMKVKVKLENVDVRNKQIDFCLV